MSGICAVWHKHDPDASSETLRAVTARLALARTEATSSAADRGAGVGVASIYSNQELYEDSSVLLACDADLFNQNELRKLAGVDCSGAALLAALYKRSGPDFLTQLRGEYSIVLWDRNHRRLLAATDGFATRALTYFENDRVFLVATRIDALFGSSQVPREIRPQALANYLNYTVNLAPGTIIKGVARVLPGHYLLVSSSGMRSQRYWDVAYHQGGAAASEEKLEKQLASVVEDSVRAHSADQDANHLGAFLSGGTDSSTVTGMLRRIGKNPVHTFSIGYAEQRFNELEYAGIAARAFDTTHHEYRVTAADCADSIFNMVRCFDEPFGNSSAIPTYFCARLAAQSGVRTLLAGDGGDELFGGNERYLTDKIFAAYDRIPGVLRRGALEPFLRTLPIRKGLIARARNYVRRASLPQPERFFSFNLLVDNPADSIFEPDFARALNGHSVLERPNLYYRQGPAVDHLDRLLYVDMKITLADNDLLKVTRMCELAGVRPRFPFLDRDVAACAGEIPANLKVKGTAKRYLFKRAFRDLLPSQIIQKKKQGFGIPVAVWMLNDKRMRELYNDVLLSARTYQRGFVRRQFVENLMKHYATDTTAFYGDTLWTFLALELWFREFIDKPQEAAA